MLLQSVEGSSPSRVAGHWERPMSPSYVRPDLRGDGNMRPSSLSRVRSPSPACPFTHWGAPTILYKLQLVEQVTVNHPVPVRVQVEELRIGDIRFTSPREQEPEDQPCEREVGSNWPVSVILVVISLTDNRMVTRGIASRLHRGGRRFDPVIKYSTKEDFSMITVKCKECGKELIAPLKFFSEVVNHINLVDNKVPSKAWLTL